MMILSKKTVILGLSFGLLMSACTNVPETYKKASELPKAEAVQETSINHVISFSSDSGGFTEREKRGLETFIFENGVGYGDELILEFAHGDLGWSTKLDAVTGYLKTIGIWVDYAGPSDSISNSSVARLVVNRYHAFAPDCLAISRQTFYPGELENSTTLGCVTAHNLAAMVAKPQDLNKGATDAFPDTYGAVRAIQLYRSTRGRDFLRATVPYAIRLIQEAVEEEK